MKSHSVILYRMLVVAVFLVTGGWSLEASAQAVVKNVELDAMDISAASSPRLDLNNEPCALIKVSILADNVDFIGNIVGDVTRHGSDYWVYVTDGTKRMRMSAPSFKNKEIRFSDWGIPEGLKGKRSYRIDIDLPAASVPVKTKRGYITFHLEPATATMLLDGQPLEVTAGTAFKLMPYGSYSYEASAPGYATFSGTVGVNSEKIEVPVTLQSTKASVEVTAATPGCQIYVDGTAIGAAPIVRELMPGNYLLEARREGYRSREMSVSLQASTRLPVNFPELEMITGELSVEYQPLGSEVRLDGASVGTTPAFLPSVPVGSHKLDISHTGYQTANLTVNISETASTPITGTLTPVDQAGEEGNWTIFKENGKYGFIDKNRKIVINAIYDDVDSFREGLARVRIGDKWGFIDKNGNTVIPFEYDFIYSFSEGLAAVKKGKKYGYIDENNNIVIPFEYEYAGDIREGFAAVDKGGKSGYIDKNGKTVIPFRYDYTGDFIEGLAPVSIGKKYGYINKNGKNIVPFEYDKARNFSNGLAAVKKYDDNHHDKWGFIDKNGNVVIPIIYDMVYNFDESGKAEVRNGSGSFYINTKGERLSETGALTPVSQAGEEENWTIFKENGKMGFKDADGKIVIDAIYDGTYSFSEGLACVNRGKKWGFIDKNNNTIIPFEYDFAGSFSEGLALVRKGSMMHGKYGFIDKNGEIAIPIDYDFAHGFSEGLASVRIGEKWGFINKNNKTVIPFEYDGAGSFSEGLAPASKGEKYGFIDKNGNVVIPFKYDRASEFSEGRAAVLKDFRKIEYGYIDNTGKIVIPFKYAVAEKFNNGIAKVRQQSDGKWGYIDKKGNAVIPVKYTSAGDFNDGLVKLRDQAGRWGFFDNNGTIVIPFEYDEASDFIGGKAEVRKGFRSFYINKKGERLP